MKFFNAPLDDVIVFRADGSFDVVNDVNPTYGVLDPKDLPQNNARILDAPTLGARDKLMDINCIKVNQEPFQEQGSGNQQTLLG